MLPCFTCPAGKLEAALGDYNAAMQLCPWSVDPVLNRWVGMRAGGAVAPVWKQLDRA